MRTALIVITAAVLIGCSTHKPAPVRSEATCHGAGLLPQTMAAPGSVVVFGEIHGVDELPGAFGEVVCAEASAGRAIAVGLEIPQGDQQVLERFLASAGTPQDVEALTATPFWSREFQDGRSSLSRVALIDRLRILRAAGLPVSVFYFDIDDGEDASKRERTMADRIATRAKGASTAVTMVLVGEVHAWKTKGAPWDPEFVPMGMSLADAGLPTWSLGRATPAGTAWVCTGASAADCGARPTRATASLPSGAQSGVEPLPAPGSHGYDGLYATTSLTASPPARPDRR